eukprot:TRINITY_DN6911_c0_g1_i2.p1 TRINITY_DN6911_c0_g1~~TRINITY_DN6911_c0_g1_i2.p1  ORF type:complete len:121 (-),score=7.68 TRINITY_DN6911_c0_g1_i2:192-554(-)
MLHRLQVLSVLGCVVTLYAIYVEKQARNHPGQFSAMCDLSESVSCSKVLTSKYSHLVAHFFDLDEDNPIHVPNTYVGLLFYIAVFLYPMFPFTLIPGRKVLLFLASSFSAVFQFFFSREG